nr:hypothetical protein [Tanacetum cinerariifolium]
MKGGEGGFRWWQWFGVEPAAVGQRQWCWLCSGGAGGGEVVEWSRWRCGVGSVGGGVDWRWGGAWRGV